mmetsp:Transcript_65924/g.154271  ORF Transcript_65924/g.154271 Transcript_65924/m.154271 type:complete len:368 (-) Transcript_65924:115-1218(-)|eukprot:s636_g11.t1
MNSWAAEGIFDCNFLCICVLGDRSAYGLCKEMSNQMKLTHCVNGFVESARDMPTYGQLGCQGFIILDKEHKVVSEGTSPFMQVRALAFQHVEALLNSVCKNLPLPDLCPGEEVQLVKAPAGLEKLQGYRGICTRAEGDKVDFGFMDGPLQGKVIAVPRSSVERLEPMDEESMQTCSNGTCGQGCSTSASKDQQAEDCGSCNGGTCKPGMGCEAGYNNAGTECDPSNCDRAECHIDPSFVSQALDLISVKVASMDSEHEECAVALRRLVETRSREVLEEVLRCLSDHFAHEEALFEEHGFGVHANEKLSAKTSHVKEHRRLLDKVRKQLSRGPSVPAPFVRELLQEFHEHTTLYDVQYADFLASKGAK